MNIFDLRKKDIEKLPIVDSSTIAKDSYFAIILIGGKKEIKDLGYSSATVILVKEKGVVGRAEFYPDSISLEPKHGVSWHMDFLPKIGGVQVWATSSGELRKLCVWGSSSMYVDAV